jgi:hypothetical protein
LAVQRDRVGRDAVLPAIADLQDLRDIGGSFRREGGRSQEEDRESVKA